MILSFSDQFLLVSLYSRFTGAHTLSGAVLEPRALNELIPDWKEKGVSCCFCNVATDRNQKSYLLHQTTNILVPLIH